MAFSRTKFRRLLPLTIGLIAATAIAGCSSGGDGSGGDADASGVPWGATAAEYQEALADLEPIELVVQSAAAAAGIPAAAPFDEFLARVEKYSGGKITFDVTYANGIVSNVLEFDDALVDGRFDISLFWPQYDPSEYPATNELISATVFRDPHAVAGWFGGQAAMQEIGLATPEIVAEWTNKGIVPLNILGQDGPTLLACREPWTSLADLQGKQVRAGGTVHARQLQELGAIPVSLPYPEIYEALQRGILDCSMSAHLVASNSGHLEVAPYVLHTDEVSFASTPTNLYAGPRVASLDPVAKQLIIESAQVYVFKNMLDQLNNIAEEVVSESTIDQVTANGGQWLPLDDEVEARLAEINEGIIADLESSSSFDGADLVSRAKAAYAAWSDRVSELGYTDDGPISTFPEWYTEAHDYEMEPWMTAVITEILAKHAPM